MAPYLRQGTVDLDVWLAMNQRNEYHLGPLRSDDRVVDIGAHIGSFAVSAYRRGSRKIFAYEPEPANYALAAKNCDGLDGLSLRNLAVVGSDATAPETVFLSEYSDIDEHTINTGSVDAFSLATAKPAATVPFDAIMDSETAFLKLDCEGAEWPILYSSRNIRLARVIAGEYHIVARAVACRLGGCGSYEVSVSGLRHFFTDRGFTAWVSDYYGEHLGKQLGHFYAVRIGSPWSTP